MTAPGIEFSGSARIGGQHLFNRLMLTAAGGQWTCLLGPSGIGKTTILRLVAGLAEDAVLDGAVGADDGAPLDGRIAYMAQSDLLMPWLDVRQNIALGARLRGGRADADRITALINETGLTDHAGKRPGALSGGMRQRVALARTLIEDRPIVLLDEPFSALDARTRAEMQELAARLLTGRTVLMVTHDPAEAARLGHAILVMTPDGLSQMPAPESAPIRPYDDPAVFECQSALMARIRAA